MPNVNTYFEALYIQEATHQLHTITHNSAAHCCDFATDVVRNYFTSTAEVLVSIWQQHLNTLITLKKLFREVFQQSCVLPPHVQQ